MVAGHRSAPYLLPARISYMPLDGIDRSKRVMDKLSNAVSSKKYLMFKSSNLIELVARHNIKMKMFADDVKLYAKDYVTSCGKQTLGENTACRIL